MNYQKEAITLKEKGFSSIENLFSAKETTRIIDCISQSEKKDVSFLKTKDLFAIRQLIVVIPELKKLLFTEKLKTVLKEISTEDYFLTKAIYFDKPKTSNWFVPYHQDLSISVSEKDIVDGYYNWTFKKGQYGVHPPIEILENTVTIRIHLDDTDANNGALKVIPESHLQGIYTIEKKEWNTADEVVCIVKRGGAMLMKPLTLHASTRTRNNKQRRVIHLEFCTQQLQKSLQWLEYSEL